MAQTRRVIIWSSSTRSPYSQEISTVSPTTSPRNPPLLQNLITTCHKIKANVVTFPPAVAVQAVQDDSQPVSKEAQDKWKQHLPTGPRPSRKQGRHLRYRIYMYLVVFICIYKIYGLSAFTLSLVQAGPVHRTRCPTVSGLNIWRLGENHSLPTKCICICIYIYICFPQAHNLSSTNSAKMIGIHQTNAVLRA